ncbi:MAG TPA: serine acetyltransferase [Methylophilaceae bacterium]|nr:serine acetyltransferase [Methylophilaceae bacterium]
MSGNGKPSSNPGAAKLLLFFCRHQVPLLGRLYKLILNCDIYCDLRNREVYLPHPYGIIIHSKTQIGQRVAIMQHVTLGGRQFGVNEAPIIEDDVYIGAGAKVLGQVRIGRGAVVGANAVVTRDVPAGATVVGANRILHPAPKSPQGSSSGNERIVRLAK